MQVLANKSMKSMLSKSIMSVVKNVSESDAKRSKCLKTFMTSAKVEERTKRGNAAPFRRAEIKSHLETQI